ncbi:hypothetical protein SPI_08829 [Niveomyces insectorum RCEF 264]|uniref:Uncharacterized protein n=1 Tax=Niveomyces insectorum RCEF 264 TaxID=1081102 RepID=A0A167MNQ9_9HYPO|nr:hypothetical protein SPI_08829 [Niveomyces insectorum RCEF 264]
MKFNTFAASAVLLSTGTFALPQEARNADVSPATPLLSARGTCQRDFTEVADVVVNGFTGRAQLAYSIAGGGITFHVCRIVNHYSTSTHPCSDYGGVVALTIGAIIQTQMTDSSSTGVGTSNKHRRDGGGDNATSVLAADIFASHLESNGFSFGQIETTTTVSRRDNNANVTGAPDVAESFVIRNVVDPTSNITAADFHYTSFADGTGYIHVIHTTVGDNGDTSHSNVLSKRHDGAGFKYNWNRYVFNVATYGADVQTLGNSVGQGIAQDWAYDSDYFLLDEWIGAIGVDYILLQAMGVAVRIIAELDGFGEEYEDVGICGDVSGAVHDELRRR